MSSRGVRCRPVNPRSKSQDVMTDPSSFDWSAALAAVCNDRDLLRDVVEVLVGDLPRLRGNLVTSFAANDLDGIRRAAHSLKGSLRFLGEIPGHHLAQRLEDLATEQQREECDTIWKELQRELDQLTPVLERFLKT